MDSDPLAEAVKRARLWLAEHEANGAPTSAERLEDVVARLTARYGPHPERPTLTVIRGGRDDA